MNNPALQTANEVSGDYQVTYLNRLSKNRCVLIDNLDSITAIQVMGHYSNRRDLNMFLNDVKVERMPVDQAADG